MKKSHIRLAMGAISAITLFSACKRDIVNPADPSLTAPRAVTPKTANFNFLSGTPNRPPVSVANITTVANSVSAKFQLPGSVVSDGSGNVWVSDYNKNQIFLVSTSTGTVLKTFGNGTAGFQNGFASSAEFNHPVGVALGPDGVLYVADMGNNLIRTVSPVNNNVFTFAGSGVAGFADGTPTVAKFKSPTGVAVDANGTVYVADYGNNMVRRIINKNSVTRWAGQPTAGSTDANGSLASFNGPEAVALSPTGALYVADINNNKIRKITSGNVTTLAGSADNSAGLVDGTGSAAKFHFPSAIATDFAGNLYVTEETGRVVRFVTPAGVVTTLAGNGTSGFTDSYGSQARFAEPMGITVDPNGNIYIADRANAAIRKMTFIRAVATLAGNGQAGYQEGMGMNALFTNPSSVAVGPNGTIYAFDNFDFTESGAPVANKRPKIRSITPDGTTSLVAGNTPIGFKDGPAAQAQFGGYVTLAVGLDGTVYMADKENNRIRKISGGVVSTLAGDGGQQEFDGTGTNSGILQPSCITVDVAGNLYVGTYLSGRIVKITPAGVMTTVNKFATVPFAVSASGFPLITGLAIDAQGHKFIAATNTIYEFAGDNQASSVYFGGFNASNMPNISAFMPTSVCIDRATGNLYAGGENANNISLITPAKNWSILAGNGNVGFADGPESISLFGGTNGLALGSNGIIYIADLNNRIRMMSKF